MSDFDPKAVPTLAWGLVLTAVGFALTLLHVFHLGSDYSVSTLLIGVLVPLAISLGVIVPFGFMMVLPRDSFRVDNIEFLRHTGPWVAGWMIMGIIWMGIAGAGSILYQPTVELTETESIFLVGIFASYGALPGSVTGYYYGRTAQSAKEVAERGRHLTVFARVLRHNFRNQMNVILGELGLAKQMADPQTAQHVSKANRYGRELMETVEKQRFLVELVTEPSEPRVQDVTRILESAAKSVRKEYPEADVSVADTVELSVLAHPQIDRAVAELLENAIVHSNEEPGSAVVETSRNFDSVVLSIHDSGAEFPAEETAILTADTDPTQLEHGSGLGLWIVNRLTAQSGGSLEIERDDLGGNTVVVTLPLAR